MGSISARPIWSPSALRERRSAASWRAVITATGAGVSSAGSAIRKRMDMILSPWKNHLFPPPFLWNCRAPPTVAGEVIALRRAGVRCPRAPLVSRHKEREDPADGGAYQE